MVASGLSSGKLPGTSEAPGSPQASARARFLTRPARRRAAVAPTVEARAVAGTPRNPARRRDWPCSKMVVNPYFSYRLQIETPRMCLLDVYTVKTYQDLHPDLRNGRRLGGAGVAKGELGRGNHLF